METPTQLTQSAKLRLSPAQIGLLIFFFTGIYLIPLLVAWDWGWVTGWVMLAVLTLSGVASRVFMALVHPDLMKERVRMFSRDSGAKGWDKALAPWFGMVLPVAGMVVVGLDHRFGWSPQVGVVAQIAAIAVLLLGVVVGTWAMVENKFFSAVVRIQTERGHTVCDTGPYRFVRHPGYASALLSYLAFPVAYSTLWALVPVVGLIALFLVRTALEDKTLQAELPGYKEYAERVRYRLLLGIW